jgi:hypothetical protein
MAEYYGYVAPEQKDLGKSIANVAEMFTAAEGKREAKRESEQKSLDEARKKINELEQNNNQSKDAIVNDAANKARNYILELERMRKSGRITGAEFNRRMGNINNSWDSYAFTTKNMNERIAENLVRQQPGEDGKIPASSGEIFLATIQSDLLNTENKEIMIGNDGDMYQVDKNDPTTPISLKATSNIENIVDPRVDVPSLIENNVSKFGIFTKEDGTTTMGGRMVDPELYNKVKYDIVHSIVDEDNPRGVVSILKDNAGADYVQYYNNTGKEKLLNEAVVREETLNGPMTPEQKNEFRSNYEKNNMIQWVPDNNGSYQPVITEKMMQDAYDYVDRNVDIQSGYTVSQDEPFKPTGPAGPKNSKVTELEKQQLADVRAAWNAKDANALRRASDDQYYFKWGAGGLEVYNKNPNPSRKEYNAQMKKYNEASQREKDQGIVKKPTEPETPKPLKTVSGVDGLYPYFFGNSGEAKWLTELERQRSNNTEPVKFNGPK